jgi:hypothetical protein
MIFCAFSALPSFFAGFSLTETVVSRVSTVTGLASTAGLASKEAGRVSGSLSVRKCSLELARSTWELALERRGVLGALVAGVL